MKRKSFLLYFSMFIAFAVSAQTKEINILAVNDMHAALDRFPQFVAMVDSMRGVYPDLLLFSAGDNRTGNPANDMHSEASYPMMVLMNKAGFNLSVVGNHEFDGRLEDLRNVVNGSNFRHVCANMQTHDSLRLHVEPYRIFEMDGVKIAVLGLLQLGVNGLPDTHPDKLKSVVFRPLDKVAEQYSWLRNHCDVFILLVHEGYEESVDFLSQYPYADVLIGGHSHTRIDSTELHNGVLLTQAKSHLEYVTHITLQLNEGKIASKKSRLLDVNAFPKKNAEVQALVDDFNNNEMFRRVLTQALNDFSSYEELGCLMTDAIRIETGADIALQNPGGVRIGTFPKGDVTVRDVYQLDPFNNDAVMFNLTGEEVLRLIKAAYIADNNRASYVSGITYEMELDKQGNVKKVQVKMADGKQINLQRTYKVVLNSYLAAVAKYDKADNGQSLFRSCSDFTIQYLEKQPAIDYKGVKRVVIKK